jgi:hypothetical protein
VESTHISRGMLRMRVNVMEFGRFTARSRTHAPQPSGHTNMNYPLPTPAKAIKEQQAEIFSSSRFRKQRGNVKECHPKRSGSAEEQCSWVLSQHVGTAAFCARGTQLT